MPDLQQVDGLYRTVCASYPRCGQSLLQPVLQDYFGGRFHYCEWYQEPDKRPNVCAQTNFVKTHDRELNWPIREDWKYLVLIRHPLDAVSSWKRLDQEEGDHNIAWKLSFYAEFVNRWVIQPVPNRLVVTYESLVANPWSTLTFIVSFLSELPVDTEKLEALIRRYDIQPREDHARAWLNYL